MEHTHTQSHSHYFQGLDSEGMGEGGGKNGHGVLIQELLYWTLLALV